MLDPEYKGPGKFLSACGGWFVGGLVGGLIGLAAATIFGGGLFLIGGLGLAGHIFGAIKGYQYAEKGEQQHQQAQLEVGQANMRAAMLEQELAPAQSTSRFTDRIQSRGSQGSYVDAVTQDQAQTAEQRR